MAEMAKRLVQSTLITSDGTPISYYQVGHGPGLIIIHGAMSAALTQLDLANALSDKYTVYLPSRRGRGLSGPYPSSLTKMYPLNTSSNKPALKDPKAPVPDNPSSNYTTTYNSSFSSQVLSTDLSDLAALVQKTGATYLLGVSSGALLALQASLSFHASQFPTITKTILFEPPLFFNPSPTSGPSSINLSQIPRYEAEIANGDISSALVTAMKIVQLGPGWLRAMPRFVIRALTTWVMGAAAKEKQKSKDAGRDDEGVTTMAALAPMLRYDFAVCEAMIGPAERFSGIGEGEATGKEILLLAGSESPGYLKEALNVLEAATKGSNAAVRGVQLEGVGHEALGNKDRGGRVDKAALPIEQFLA